MKNFSLSKSLQTHPTCFVSSVNHREKAEKTSNSLQDTSSQATIYSLLDVTTSHNTNDQPTTRLEWVSLTTWEGSKALPPIWIHQCKKSHPGGCNRDKTWVKSWKFVWDHFYVWGTSHSRRIWFKRKLIFQALRIQWTALGNAASMGQKPALYLHLQIWLERLLFCLSLCDTIS